MRLSSIKMDEQWGHGFRTYLQFTNNNRLKKKKWYHWQWVLIMHPIHAKIHLYVKTVIFILWNAYNNHIHTLKVHMMIIDLVKISSHCLSITDNISRDMLCYIEGEFMLKKIFFIWSNGKFKGELKGMDTLITLFKTVLCRTWDISLDAPKSSSS